MFVFTWVITVKNTKKTLDPYIMFVVNLLLQLIKCWSSILLEILMIFYYFHIEQKWNS